MDAATVRWVNDASAFAALAPAWERLARDEPSPFLSHAWLRCWWDAFGTGAPRVCTVWRGDDLVAAMPLARVRRRLHAWAGPDTDLFRPLARTPADLDVLVGALVRCRFDDLTVRALPAEDEASRALLAALERNCVVSFERAQLSPIIDTVGSLADYRRGMSRNTRQRVGKLRRRMQRDHWVELAMLTAPADVDAELQEALELEASGWKGRAGSAVLCSDRELRFYRCVARAFHAQDGLRLSRLRLDGRLVAFDIALVRGRRVYSLNTSYDEGFAQYSPGLVLRMAIVEACFAQGLEANELLGSLLDWKTSFITSTRETCVLRAYRRSPVPMLRYAARRTVLPLLRRPYDRARGVRRAWARRRRPGRPHGDVPEAGSASARDPALH